MAGLSEKAKELFGKIRPPGTFPESYECWAREFKQNGHPHRCKFHEVTDLGLCMWHYLEIVKSEIPEFDKRIHARNLERARIGNFYIPRRLRLEAERKIGNNVQIAS